MTNADLKKKYQAVFPYFYLANIEGKTILTGTHKTVTAMQEAFAYAPAIDDFVKINYQQIVAIIKPKLLKSKI